MFTCHCGETTSEANYNSDMCVHVALSSLDKHPLSASCSTAVSSCPWTFMLVQWSWIQTYLLAQVFLCAVCRSACASPNVAECWSDALTLKITNSFTYSTMMINCSHTFVLILNNFQIFGSVFIANIEL